MIEGRYCDVKIPHSQEESFMTSKIFVGRITEAMTKEDLQKHFEQFGEVQDVYIPAPFRAFAFVTFKDSNVAQSLIGEDMIINGASVYINTANPKNKDNAQNGMSSSQTQGLNFTLGNQNFNPNNYGFPASAPRSHPSNGNDAGSSPGGAVANYGANMMNPAVLAAAWNSMMNGIFRGNVDPMNVLQQNKSNTPGSGRGDGGSDWRNSQDGANHWNIK